MSLLLLGLLLFLVPHFVSVFKQTRGKVMAIVGELPFKIIYSLVSLVGLFAIVKGYAALRADGNIQLYAGLEFLRPVTLILMAVALILFVASNLRCRIQTLVVHPQIAAVKIWAFAHLLVNGDLASVLLFGSFLAWAVIARIGYKRQGIMTVKHPLSSWGKNDAIAIVVGLAVYLVFVIWAHPWLFGVPVMP